MRRAVLAGLVATACWAALAGAQAPPDRHVLDASEPITYFIADGEPGSEYRRSDRDLAAWALAAWQKSAGGVLTFAPADEADALLRVYFVPASAGQYGEMRPFVLDGRLGGAVFVRPDTEALGPDIGRLATEDPLLREAIVYLTCLHELGHALGLVHTADYDDVMYFFGFGGDIPGFFARYRERLGDRADIANVAGLSSGDLAQLKALYPAD